MNARPEGSPLVRVRARIPGATALRNAEDAAESTSAKLDRRKPESRVKASRVNPSIRLGKGLRRHGRRWMMDGTPPRHVAPLAASAISNGGAQARGYRAVAWPRFRRDAAAALGINERLLFPEHER